MKGIVLLVVGALLLLAAAGGGYYAYTKFLSPPPAEVEKPVKPPPPPSPIYLRVPPFVVPVVGAERVEQAITLVIVLQVRDQAVVDSVSGRMPRVTDTFMTTVYSAIEDGEVLTGSLVSIPALKKRLQAVSDQFFGKGAVTDVLIQTLQQRRL